MQINQQLLTINEYSRPGKNIKEVLAIVIHWTANPFINAIANRNFFENRKTGMGGYGSAHYIIDKSGEIILCIPENEVAYHCGTSKADPASARLYTDYAREKFGKYAVDYKTNSPNFCTIGIELCPVDTNGNFTEQTIQSAVNLCADICKRYNLTEKDITTHHNIVGWKDCPKLWTEYPELLDAFKSYVKNTINK